MKRGQFIRLLIGEKVIGAAKEMEFTFNAQTEDVTTKDVTNDWQEYMVVSTSYQITSSALVLTHNDEMAGNSYQLFDALGTVNDTAQSWKIANVSGDNNRTIDTVIMSGNAKVTQLDINASNSALATFTTTLNGVGELVVSA